MKKYVVPSAEIIRLEEADVVRTSIDPSFDNVGGYDGWQETDWQD